MTHPLRRPASILGTFALTLVLSVPSISAARGPLGTQTCGPSFQVVDSPDPSPIGIPEDVAAISSDDVWAVGTDVEHWDGAQWSVVDSPNPSYLFGTSAVSSDDVWAVGTDVTGARTYIQHWDGSVWERVHSPNTANDENVLKDVVAVSTDDVWAVGFSSNNFGRSRPLVEHWDGTRWTIVASPSPGNGSYLESVSAASADDVWAVGGKSNKTMVEHWDGTLWSLVSSPNVGHSVNALNAVVALASDDVWAVGFKDGNIHALIEHWDGTAWNVAQSPPGDTGLADVAAASSGDIWATSSQGFPTLVTHWDGTRWSQAYIPDRNGDSQLRASGVGVLSTGEAWIVGYDTGATTTVKWHLCPTEVSDSGFSPASSTVPRGSTAAWVFPASNLSGHSVTDDTGLGLFDSGLRDGGTSFVFRFTAAGTYPIVDTLFPTHVGSISVPVDVTPPEGTVTTIFEIAWATGAPPGYLFDVQITRPGDPNWADWQSGVTSQFASFTPDSGTGTYSFRARLRSSVNGATSDWSPVASIVVTP